MDPPYNVNYQGSIKSQRKKIDRSLHNDDLPLEAYLVLLKNAIGHASLHTRSPYCMVNASGLKISDNSRDGAVAVDTVNENTSFFYVHWYHFPLIQMFDEFSGSCREGGDIELTYLSELDPTWEDDTLALTLFPETTQFANPVSQLACAADATSALTGLPNDKLFWCAGAQGSMYPVTGHVGEHIGGVQASVLLSERLDFKLHRLGIVKDSNPSNLCTESTQPIMPKSRYRYQMVYPKATTSSHGCQPFGRSTMKWGANFETPASTENYSYLIWRKRNCCNF
ncbi:MAG: TraU family protein [Gammaproteobacteria bacterium]